MREYGDEKVNKVPGYTNTDHVSLSGRVMA